MNYWKRQLAALALTMIAITHVALFIFFFTGHMIDPAWWFVGFFGWCFVQMILEMRR